MPPDPALLGVLGQDARLGPPRRLMLLLPVLLPPVVPLVLAGLDALHADQGGIEWGLAAAFLAPRRDGFTLLGLR